MNNIKKSIVSGALVACLSIAGLGSIANASAVKNEPTQDPTAMTQVFEGTPATATATAAEVNGIAETEDNFEEYTFDMFKADSIKNSAASEQLNKAEELFTKAMQLDQSGNYEDAQKLIDQLYALSILK